jgi:hypothetical protein
MNTVYEAAQYVDGSDPQYTMIVYKPGSQELTGDAET